MIQRVQTLFLLGIALLSAAMLFLPFEQVNVGDAKHMLCLMPGCLKEMVKPFVYVPIGLNIVILGLSLFTIFKYNQRKQQMKFAQLLMVLSVLLMGNLFTMHFLKVGDATVVDYKIAALFPALNIVLAFLARMFIKKDDDLVKSADRIR